jgi:filamentous hemagglutinin
MKDVKPEDLAAAEAQWKKANPGKEPTSEDISKQVYQTAYDKAFNESGFGTGGQVQRAIQAATAAVQGLAGGDMAAALANGTAPYITKLIADSLPNDPAARTLAHAAVNAALAAAQGNNALVGAGGAVTGELLGMIAVNAYGKPVSELSESEKQTVSALATLAAGLAGGLIGDSTADVVAGAQTGKTVVENNSLSGDKAWETVKQTANTLKDQVRDKLGEGTLSSIVNSIIGAAADTGDAVLGTADYGADTAMALTACAVGDGYCNQALSDLAGKNQAAADMLKALMKSETWSAVAETVKEAAQGNQLALEATGGMLAGLFLPGKKLPDALAMQTISNSVVDAKKFDYLFGRASGSPHTLDRTNQLSLEMKRLGVTDDMNGHAMLAEHFTVATKDPSNIVKKYTDQFGSFEVRESLFIGPSGKATMF